MYLRRIFISLLAIGLAAPATASEKDSSEAKIADEKIANEEKILDKELEFVDGSPERCLSLVQIDQTEVLDEYNILFHLRGGKVYRNHLPHRCPGLSRRETFMYKTSQSQLCNVDLITVLEDIGFGFTQGASCGLGMFYPVSEENVKKLKEMGKNKKT